MIFVDYSHYTFVSKRSESYIHLWGDHARDQNFLSTNLLRRGTWGICKNIPGNRFFIKKSLNHFSPGPFEKITEMFQNRRCVLRVSILKKVCMTSLQRLEPRRKVWKFHRWYVLMLKKTREIENIGSDRFYLLS